MDKYSDSLARAKQIRERIAELEAESARLLAEHESLMDRPLPLTVEGCRIAHETALGNLALREAAHNGEQTE